MSEDDSKIEPIEHSLGSKTFLTWNPPAQPTKVGNIIITEGNGVCINSQGTNSSSESFWPTIKLEYEKLEQDELSRWVLFHAFVTDNPWTLPSYMGTIHGVVKWLDKPFGQLRNYLDFINVAYRYEREKVKLIEKMSYSEMFQRFRSINEKQIGMVKNLLLDMKPGQSWFHGEMADYSYWRMVIDFSIIDGIIGQQPFCSHKQACELCGKTEISHYPVGARDYVISRLLEITGDKEKSEQYMKIIWTVRQNIRHKTAHESAYPEERPFSKLKHGDNEFGIDTIIKTFENDGHALSALEQSMHEVTRILLLDNILNTKIFPNVRPYLIRSGGMSWAEYQELLTKASKE